MSTSSPTSFEGSRVRTTPGPRIDDDLTIAHRHAVGSPWHPSTVAEAESLVRELEQAIDAAKAERTLRAEERARLFKAGALLTDQDNNAYFVEDAEKVWRITGGCDGASYARPDYWKSNRGRRFSAVVKSAGGALTTAGGN